MGLKLDEPGSVHVLSQQSLSYLLSDPLELIERKSIIVSTDWWSSLIASIRHPLFSFWPDQLC